MTISTSPPPLSFATGPFYTQPLTIYYLEGRYWVRDQEGIFCSTDDLQDLHRLLVAESLPPPADLIRYSPSDWHRYLRPGARDIAIPGSAEAKARKVAEAEVANRKFAEENEAKREAARTRAAIPADPELALRALGL